MIGEYTSALSSDDLFHSDLPMKQKRAKGGTMIMWKNKLLSFIRRPSSPSSCILPILFSPPNATPTIHISVYLPTPGRDNDFMEELSILTQFLSDLNNTYPGFPIYVRVDMNSNVKRKIRHEFCLRQTLIEEAYLPSFLRWRCCWLKNWCVTISRWGLRKSCKHWVQIWWSYGHLPPWHSCLWILCAYPKILFF